jgi:poly(hydroxyalkanoate) depolymerase family esterase
MGFTYSAFAGKVDSVTDAKVYVPTTYRPGMPMVVMLCGASEGPFQAMKRTQWNELAEKEGFIVLYPQRMGGLISFAFWTDFTRDDENPRKIVQATNAASEKYAVDKSRIYIAGLSAGGAMATNTVIAYPDVYAAAAIASAPAYHVCAGADVLSHGLTRIINADPVDPLKHVAFARKQMGENYRKIPLIVGHGDADGYVLTTHGIALINQWCSLMDVDSTDYKLERNEKYNRYIYGDGDIVLLLIKGMGHTWSGNGEPSYKDGPDETQLFWEFLSRYSKQKL